MYSGEEREEERKTLVVLLVIVVYSKLVVTHIELCVCVYVCVVVIVSEFLCAQFLFYSPSQAVESVVRVTVTVTPKVKGNKSPNSIIPVYIWH